MDRPAVPSGCDLPEGAVSLRSAAPRRSPHTHGKKPEWGAKWLGERHQRIRRARRRPVVAAGRRWQGSGPGGAAVARQRAAAEAAEGGTRVGGRRKSGGVRWCLVLPAPGASWLRRAPRQSPGQAVPGKQAPQLAAAEALKGVEGRR